MSSRPVQLRTQADRMLAMALHGVWQCASWAFALWGLFQGASLGTHRLPAGSRFAAIARDVAATTLSWLAIFALVVLGWVFFHSPDLKSALLVLGHILAHDLAGVEWLFLPVWIMLPIVAVARLLGILAERARMAEARARLNDSIRIRLPGLGLEPMRFVVPRRIVTGAFLVTAWIILLFLFSPAEPSALVYFQF